MQEIPNSPKSTKYVASSYWDGNYYANNSNWQFHVASIALTHIKIPTNAKILDIGCGDGRFTKFLAQSIPHGKVLGIDSSLSMLEVAQSNAMPNLSFVQGDAMDLAFKNQFDYIVAFNSLHWVSEIPIALEQVQKALIPGGQILILVAPTQVRHPIHQIINEVANQEQWYQYFNRIPNIFSFYTPAEWATMIEKSKMIPECLKLIDASLDYPDKKSFADFIAGWVPFGTIPENKRRTFVNDIVESYVTLIPVSPDGIVHYRMDELVIIASKKHSLNF